MGQRERKDDATGRQRERHIREEVTVVALPDAFVFFFEASPGRIKNKEEKEKKKKKRKLEEATLKTKGVKEK